MNWEKPTERTFGIDFVASIKPMGYILSKQGHPQFKKWLSVFGRKSGTKNEDCYI